jgi:hypothetical protein
MTTGVAPTNFTNRFTTTDQTWTVESVSEAEDDRVFRYVHTASAVRLFSFDDVDADSERQDSEIVVRWRINDADAHLGFSLWLNGSGAAGTEDGYLVQYELQFGVNEQFQLKRYDAGTPTDIGSTVVFSGNRPLIDVWYYARFRKNGTALQFRVWNEGSAEPTDWLIDRTDSDLDVDGWVGVGVGNQDQFEIDYVGVGTNGDTAPIDASTNTIARITHMGAKVVQQNDAGQIRLTQLAAKVIGQNDAGDIRLTHLGLKVLHAGPILLAVDQAIPVEATQGITSSAHFGDGLSIENPILIFTAADLIAIDLTKHYALANDINVTAENWTPLGAATTSFTGSLDGHGFKVFGLNSTYVADAFGLFWRMGGTGIIRNLGVATTVGGITGQSSALYTGVLVGIGNNVSGWLIEDCWVEGKLDTGGDRCGGLIGVCNFNNSPDSNLRRNRVAVWLSGTIGTRVGGVTGFSSGTGLTHSDNYFDSDVATTTSQGTGTVGTAKTTTLMQEEATFNNFDFTNVWFIDEGVDYPYLIAKHPVTRFPVEWQEPNPLARISTLTTEVLRQGDPLARVSTQIAEVLRQGDPLGRISTLAVEVLRTISTGTPVTSDHAIPIEWLAGIAADSVIPVEWTQGIDSDHQIPILWDGSFFADYPIHIEWFANLELDYQIPAEWGLELSQDHQIPIDWFALLASDHEIPIAWNRMVRGRKKVPKEHKRKVRLNYEYPIEWGGGVAGDQVVPAEWLGAFAGDQQMHIDWSGILQLNYQVPIEWGARLPDSDHGIPAEWGAGLAIDYVVPIEWFGGFVASYTIHIDWSGILDADSVIPAEWASIITPSDHQIPAEWGGGIEPVAFDAIPPIEWGAGVAGDQEILAEWLAGLAAGQLTPAEWIATIDPADHTIPAEWLAIITASDHEIPAEWTQGAAADHEIPIEWLAGVAFDHITPIEWLAAFEGAHQVPIEWGTVLEPLFADSEIPVEWTAGVAGDQQAPVEWLAALAADYVIPAEWLASLFSDQPVPVEWIAAFLADYQIPFEWRSSIEIAVRIPAEWTSGVDADSIMPVEWIIATDPVVTNFQMPVEWTSGLAADSTFPLAYTVVVRFDRNEIPTEWRLEGFQPFTPIDDKQFWQAVCSPVVWTIEESGTSWIADPAVVAQAYPDTTAAAADPVLTAWVACSSDSEWRADDFCGIAWRADPPLLWTAERSQGRWTAEADPV